jgi:hypothetical protein
MGYRRGMRSERTRIGIIFAVVAVVVGGGAFYFFKIYQPKHALAGAQDEIATWETRWAAARSCLLGGTPGSSRTSEALAIHELSPDPWDRGSCTPLVGKLVRGLGDDTGIGPIELVWVALDRAATHAAVAFADHLSHSTVRVDHLPAALDALDAARADLRAAAELPAETQGGTALVAAQLIPLVDGAEPITKLEIEERETRELPSAHGAQYFARTATHEVQLALAPGRAPIVGRVGPGWLRAVPDATWGATPVQPVAEQKIEGGVRVGAFDVEGAMATPMLAGFAKVAIGAKPELDGELRIGAALGTLADGVVVYRTALRLAIARTTPTPLAPEVIAIDAESAGTAADLDGRGIVAWRSANKQMIRWLAPLGAPLQVPEQIDSACFTGDRAWLQTPQGLIAFRDGKLARSLYADPLVGCTAEAAVTRNDDEVAESYELCTEACRKVTLPGAPRDASVTTIDGKLVAVAAHDGVLGVWRELAPPKFFALPELVHPVRVGKWPVLALTDGKVIDVLARRTTGFAIVRIPAR